MRLPNFCGSCGSRIILPENVKGKTFPYKDLDITLKFNFYLPTCNNCGEMYYQFGDGRSLDILLEKSLEVEE